MLLRCAPYFVTYRNGHVTYVATGWDHLGKESLERDKLAAGLFHSAGLNPE